MVISKVMRDVFRGISIFKISLPIGIFGKKSVLERVCSSF